MNNKYDILIIGSGIAGLAFAIKVAEQSPDCHIAILTKAGRSESNTSRAQGGIAAVMDNDNDSFFLHAGDTMEAGAHINESAIVRKVIEEAPDRVQDLMRWGVQFDCDDEGQPLLRKEGGHTANRILHYGDQTGKEILEKLWWQVIRHANIEIFNGAFATDLLLDTNGFCAGAYVLEQETGDRRVIYAQHTLLATGGAGQVYASTTNPPPATGDGIAMAHRAGAFIQDMEMVQFHPTALDKPGMNPLPLFTEALRGAGAHLRNTRGERFMQNYHHLAELAPRHIVSVAIEEEKKKANASNVYLDLTPIPLAELKEAFPRAYHHCRQFSYDPVNEWVPVKPAAHYLCGGIAVDEWGRTSIPHLYACGECAQTGLHGANRLASNSLLEALVFAHRCSIDVMKKFISARERVFPSPVMTCTAYSSIPASTFSYLFGLVQEVMERHAGVTMTYDDMQKGMGKLAEIEKEFERKWPRPLSHTSYWELWNTLTNARLILYHAWWKKDNTEVQTNENTAKYQMARCIDSR